MKIVKNPEDFLFPLLYGAIEMPKTKVSRDF